MILDASFDWRQVMHVSASICPGAVQVHFKRNGTSAIQPTTPLDHQVYSPINKRKQYLALKGKLAFSTSWL